VALPLLVRIATKETGAQIDAGFRRSPVRIGRNHLNDLAIDESFVSQWHGIVRFDDAATRFLDLGSTNGTFREGERLETHVEVELDADTKLAIGPLRLTFDRVALTDAQIHPRRASAFSLGGTSAPARGIARGGTLELGGRPGATSADKSAIGKGELKAIADRQKAVIAELAPLYEKYEAAWAELKGPITRALEDVASEAEAEVRRGNLEARFPLAFEQAALRTSDGDQTTQITEWLARLAPQAAERWERPEAALERAGAVLEAFVSAYSDLRAGQKQIRADLGVEPGAETQSLPDTDDPRALIEHLLDPKVDGGERIDDLTRSFADLALHQLGIVSGATDGARALLGTLAPQSIEGSSAIARTSYSASDMFWPWRAARSYYRVVEKLLEVSTGERFRTHLFGAAFARAYYRVTGRR
jgi:hypothetical protein